ncbi:MAG: HEAT repeat domain-containing protein [SAR324 cluster bacterium]|nr:HEAT repeat domain-containing protein [SAR324 cluster bacterium]
MGIVIELRDYKDNSDSGDLPSDKDSFQEVTTARQLVAFVKKTEGSCALTINLPKVELAKAIPQLVELLHKSNPAIQKHVLEILGNMGMPEVVPHIIPYCFQPDPYLKAQAVKSLELLGQPSAILPLKDLLKDKNQRIQKIVRNALSKLISNEFLLTMVSNEEEKSGISTEETFFELISIFNEEEFHNLSPGTMKSIIEFFRKNHEKARRTEEKLLQKQWEADAVTQKLFELQQQLKQKYSESRLELDLFRKSILSHTEERHLLPGVIDTQSHELEQLHTRFDDLTRENADAKLEISKLLATLEEQRSQHRASLATRETEAEEDEIGLEQALTASLEENETENEDDELELEESLGALDSASDNELTAEHFDPGIVIFNEEILDDLLLNDQALESSAPAKRMLSEKIVMVEQNHDASDYLKSLLRYAGFSNIVVFHDGRLAYETIRQSHDTISLILTARSIPQMNGLELLTKVRSFEQENGLKPCPVLMITEDLNTYKVNELHKAGANEVFPRLFIPENFVDRVIHHSGAKKAVSVSNLPLEAAKEELLNLAKTCQVQFCKTTKKRITLSVKFPQDLRAAPTRIPGFQEIFKTLIEFSIVSAVNRSTVTLHFKSTDSSRDSVFQLNASFIPDKGNTFLSLENQFNDLEDVASGELKEVQNTDTLGQKFIQITLAFSQQGMIQATKDGRHSSEDFDDEEVFDLLDDLEEDGSDIQKIVSSLHKLCEEEPFRLFSVLDYLHDGHFEQAHREILEMLQKLDRVDIIPYLIRRFPQLHKEYKLWTLSFIAEKDLKAGLYFIISVLRDEDEEVRHRVLSVLLKHFDASFLHLLMHSFVRTFHLPRTIKQTDILRRLPPKERSAFFQVLLYNESFELSVPFLFGYLDAAAPYEQESIYTALAAQESLAYLAEEQTEILKNHFEQQQVLRRLPRITLSLLLSTKADLLKWLMKQIKPAHWVEVFKARFVKDIKSGWEAMGMFVQEGMQEILDHIVQADELLEAETLAEDQEKEIYRMLHMSKGIALSLDLEILVALYHYVEDLWSHTLNRDDMDLAELDTFKKHYKCLLDVTKAASRILRLAEHDDSFLREKIALNSVFPRMQHLFNKLTTMLRKKATLTLLEEKEFYLNPNLLNSLNEMLIQLLKNSVDHGVELSEARLRAGKSEVGEIQLRIGENNGNLQIIVSDDGQGLQTEKIAKKCIEKNLLTEAQATALLTDPARHHELYDFIFASQFSTAQTTSEVSGRGVGMDIIKSELNDMGGTIAIESKAGIGSSFILQIPLQENQIVTEA